MSLVHFVLFHIYLGFVLVRGAEIIIKYVVIVLVLQDFPDCILVAWLDCFVAAADIVIRGVE